MTNNTEAELDLAKAFYSLRLGDAVEAFRAKVRREALTEAVKVVREEHAKCWHASAMVAANAIGRVRDRLVAMSGEEPEKEPEEDPVDAAIHRLRTAHRDTLCFLERERTTVLDELERLRGGAK